MTGQKLLDRVLHLCGTALMCEQCADRGRRLDLRETFQLPEARLCEWHRSECTRVVADALGKLVGA